MSEIRAATLVLRCGVMRPKEFNPKVTEFGIAKPAL